MSIEQTDVVDIIGTDRTTGDVILTISDHLDWLDSPAHQLLLQVKMNRYLAFIESGEIEQSYESAKGRAVVIEIVFKFVPDDGGRAFLAKARDVTTKAGFTLLTDCTPAHRLIKLDSSRQRQGVKVLNHFARCEFGAGVE